MSYRVHIIFEFDDEGLDPEAIYDYFADMTYNLRSDKRVSSYYEDHQ